MIGKKALVVGRVQGVYYRATAARRARELDIKGYARNLSDGRVEVLAWGETKNVKLFLDWLWIGSSAAKVTAVEVSEIELEPSQVPEDFGTG